jgi:hypothetical protein
MTRANPFGDLSDFEPVTEPKPVPIDAIEAVSELQGFPSRKAGQPNAARSDTTQSTNPQGARRRRRRTTSFNRQVNIKATEETVERLHSISAEEDLPLGAVLERALDAFERMKRADREQGE